jgi:hypothetical protein
LGHRSEWERVREDELCEERPTMAEYEEEGRGRIQTEIKKVERANKTERKGREEPVFEEEQRVEVKLVGETEALRLNDIHRLGLEAATPGVYIMPRPEFDSHEIAPVGGARRTEDDKAVYREGGRLGQDRRTDGDRRSPNNGTQPNPLFADIVNLPMPRSKHIEKARYKERRGEEERRREASGEGEEGDQEEEWKAMEHIQRPKRRRSGPERDSRARGGGDRRQEARRVGQAREPRVLEDMAVRIDTGRSAGNAMVQDGQAGNAHHSAQELREIPAITIRQPVDELTIIVPTRQEQRGAVTQAEGVAHSQRPTQNVAQRMDREEEMMVVDAWVEADEAMEAMTWDQLRAVAFGEMVKMLVMLYPNNQDIKQLKEGLPPESAEEVRQMVMSDERFTADQLIELIGEHMRTKGQSDVAQDVMASLRRETVCDGGYRRVFDSGLGFLNIVPRQTQEKKTDMKDYQEKTFRRQAKAMERESRYQPEAGMVENIGRNKRQPNASSGRWKDKRLIGQVESFPVTDLPTTEQVKTWEGKYVRKTMGKAGVYQNKDGELYAMDGEYGWCEMSTIARSQVASGQVKDNGTEESGDRQTDDRNEAGKIPIRTFILSHDGNMARVPTKE